MLHQVVNDSLNPVWNQTFDFVVEDGLHDMLVLEVWDHDTFGKVKPNPNPLLPNDLYFRCIASDGCFSRLVYNLLVFGIGHGTKIKIVGFTLCVKDYIGRCILTLTRVIMEEEYKDWFPLDESKSGKLQLHLKWMAQSIYRDS